MQEERFRGASDGAPFRLSPAPIEISVAQSPNHDGPRTETLGCVIHSTRGGSWTYAGEFKATIAWFASPASQVSAHVVIAFDGTLARCLDDRLIAWHARSPANETMLGAELVQNNPGEHVADAQLATLAWWLQQMSARYGFPLDEAHLPEHKDIPAGILEGKTDCGPDYSFSRLAAFLG